MIFVRAWQYIRDCCCFTTRQSS